MARIKTAFEWAETGPNAGSSGYDPPAIWRPGKLKRSTFVKDKEKSAVFDGDGTRLMPHLRAIHKLGGISDSEVGIEDLDALKTTGRHYARQAQRAFSDKPSDTGPGYAADHDDKTPADGGNEPESSGSWPIEEPEAGEGSKALFRKHIKGLQKRAAGVLSMDLRAVMPRLDEMAAAQQRELLDRAVFEARMRGGEMRSAKEPAAMAMAGRKALEGAQYARLVDADVDAINAQLARRALEKRSEVLEKRAWVSGRLRRRKESKGPDREKSLKILAQEINDELVKDSPIDHIKQRGLVADANGMGGLESQFLEKTKTSKDSYRPLHAYSSFEGQVPTSTIFNGAPKGFTLVLKRDDAKERRKTGRPQQIPDSARTPGYRGDYPKIDWTYPHPDIQGQGVTRRYFQAVERGAKKAGYPSLHIDATNSGLSYWTRKEFGMQVPKELHSDLRDRYKEFKQDPTKYVEQAVHDSSYVRIPTDDKEITELPDSIDPNKPHEIPRLFWDVIGARGRRVGGTLPLYKKFDGALEKRSSWDPWLKSESLTGRIKVAEAKLKTELLPHQKRVVERIKKQPGLVVAHGLGSGKTLSSIAAAVVLEPDKTKVLVPASLKANYQKEIDKHVEGNLPVEVGSLQGAVAKMEFPKADLLVVDEAHRGRNPQSKTFQVISGAKADKRLLLTASPTYNRPSDVASLVNMAAGERVMPMGTSFDEHYIAKPKKGVWGLLPFTRKREGLKRKGKLKKVLSEWVDYHKSGGKGFPDVEEERHSVKMTKRQTQLHDAAWGQLSMLSKLRLRRGLPPDKQDLSKINQFQSQTRQISSTESPYTKGRKKVEIAPKIVRAVGLLDDANKANPDHRALVYSNYLGTLNDYSKQLKKKKIPHAIFTGAKKMRDRKQMVEDYNKGKLKALLVSSAGGEGLDLKGTRLVQVLEPHWNVEKLKQVEGRAIRRGSHSHLPKDQQKVKLQRFESYPRGGILKKRRGVEQVLNDLAANKERLNQELLGLMEKKAEKPYRERVEVFALTPGKKVLVGQYPGDQSVGTYGGGIDPGEDAVQAGRREFREESGRTVRNVRAIDVPPYVAPFSQSERKTPKQRRRAEMYSGSRTHYLMGTLGPKSKTKSHETGTYLKDIRLRPIGEAIAQQEDAVGRATGLDRKRIEHRLKVLQELERRGLLKTAFAMPTVENKGYQKKVRRRFDKLVTALDKHGDPVGTGHKRIIIPKRIMKEDDLLGQLGFVPVKVAIPEAGQSRFASFRHPNNLFHIHEHEDAWVMHKDDHPASTMLMKKWKMARDSIKKSGEKSGKTKAQIKKELKSSGSVLKPVGNFIKGLPHVITEGIPGAYYYTKGRIFRSKGMRERVEEAIPSSYMRQINRWTELKKSASSEYAPFGMLAQ